MICRGICKWLKVRVGGPGPAGLYGFDLNQGELYKTLCMYIPTYK